MKTLQDGTAAIAVAKRLHLFERTKRPGLYQITLSHGDSQSGFRVAAKSFAEIQPLVDRIAERIESVTVELLSSELLERPH